MLEKRNAWLTAAIEHELDAKELAALPALVRMLDRLADSDAPPVARRPSDRKGTSE